MKKIKEECCVFLSRWPGLSEPLALHLQQERLYCVEVKFTGFRANCLGLNLAIHQWCDLGKPM